MNGKEYLAANPNCDVVHSTSDGTLFYNACDAKSHAQTLDDKTVETFNQEKKMAESNSKEDAKLLAATSEKVEEPKVDAPKVEEPKVEEPKADAPKVEEPRADAAKVVELKDKKAAEVKK